MNNDQKVINFGNNNTIPNSNIALGNTIGGDLIQTINIISDIIIPPPPEPTRPPLTSSFLGREDALKYFATLLSNHHIAVITGPPGIGKTQLAAKLAFQVRIPDEIFWHSFHKDEPLDAILWKLAGFPAYHHNTELWALIQRAFQTRGQLPPPEVLFDYIMQLFRGRNYLLCLDEFHYADHDPLSEHFARRVRSEVEAGQLDVIITTRRSAGRMVFAPSESLGPIDQQTAQAFLIHQGLNLSDAQVSLVHTKTEGNIEFLELAANALKRAKHIDRVLKNLSRASNIQATLMDHVDKSLSAEERLVMEALAVLQGRSASSDLIEAILDGRNIRRTLHGLSSTYLVMMDDDDDEPRYRQHTMVQEFYYDLIETSHRSRMHSRAAAFYEAEKALLSSAQHYFAAQEYQRAAQIACHDPWYFLNRAEGRAVGTLLESFLQANVLPDEWTLILITLADIYTAFQEYERPEALYHQAFATLDMVTTQPLKMQYTARIAYGLGTLLEYHDPEAALEWIEQGIARGETLKAYEKALLYIRMGSILIGVGAFERAKTVLEHGQALLPPDAILWQGHVQTNLGVLYASQGNAKHAIDQYQRALTIYQTFQHQWNMIAVLQNIAIEHDIAGEWETAITEYDQVLRMAQDVGSIRSQTSAHLAIGILLTKRGDYSQAHSHLDAARSLASIHSLDETSIACLSSIAHLLILEENYEAAESLLREAERFERERGGEDQLPEIYRNMAAVHLATGHSPRALMVIENSLQLAHNLGLSRDIGISLRVKGLVLGALEQKEAAQACFEESHALLVETDPYEAALTQQALGSWLIRTGHDCERGAALCNEARQIFQVLGVLSALHG
ncbi:MAG TPA: tetratricopeptide repeat protein [Herpetosiphonaceae bacterium]|nr:tetratricopeptide repeat protein [Herpetosiphonaceae bacterium]